MNIQKLKWYIPIFVQLDKLVKTKKHTNEQIAYSNGKGK